MTGCNTLSLVLLVGLCSNCNQPEKSKVPGDDISSQKEIIETVTKTILSVIYRSSDAGKKLDALRKWNSNGCYG